MTEAETIKDAEGAGPDSADHGDDRQPAPVQWVMVKPESIERLWPQIEPLLRKATEWSPVLQRLEGLTSIKQRCLADFYQVAVCIDGGYYLNGELRGGAMIGVLVSRLTTHPGATVLDIHYGAGEGVLQHLPTLWEKTAWDLRAAGARMVRIVGRSGWERALADIGFEKAATVFVKDV